MDILGENVVIIMLVLCSGVASIWCDGDKTQPKSRTEMTRKVEYPEMKTVDLDTLEVGIRKSKKAEIPWCMCLLNHLTKLNEFWASTCLIQTK